MIVCDPVAPSVPLQLPDAIQLVAYCDDHVIVVELPAGIADSPKVTIGAGGTTPTLKPTELPGETAPDVASVQVIEYVRIPVGAGVSGLLPLVASVPLHSAASDPVAAHDEVPSDDQVIVVVPPAAIALLLKDNVGGPPGN